MSQLLKECEADGFLFVCFGCVEWHGKLALPGIEPAAHTLEAQSLNHWTPREV